MALAVIEKTTRKWHEIERALTQGICGERERRSIENCERNLGRIEHLLSPDTNNELKSSLAQLKTLIDANFRAGEDRRFSVRCISSGESLYYCIHALLYALMYGEMIRPSRLATANYNVNLWGQYL